MKQRRYKAVGSTLLAVLLVLAASAENKAVAVERPASGMQSETGGNIPGDTRAAETGGSSVFWVLGGGMVVVSLVARRKSAGFRLLPGKR